MEQFLAWHRAHSVEADTKQPVTYLILLADGLHYFIGGLAIGASFIVSTEVGVRGGWGRRNFIYIAASDLIPEVKHDRLLHNNLVHFGAFLGGIALILVTRAISTM